MSEFVATFLGPATLHDGDWVRPHDLEVSKTPSKNASPGVVERIAQLGFEVRVEVRLDDGSPTYIQLARRAFDGMGLSVGDRVYVAVAATIPVGQGGTAQNLSPPARIPS